MREQFAHLIAAGPLTADPTAQLIWLIVNTGLIGLAFIDMAYFHKVIAPQRRVDQLEAQLAETVPRWVLDDKQRRIDQLEAALDTMTGNFMTEVVPLLSTTAVEVRKSAAIAERYVEVLQERDRDR